MAGADTAAAPVRMTPANQVRQVAKWVIAAFAAVGATLAAGVPLSNLGAVSGLRLALAVIAGVIALAGIVVAVTFVSKTLDPKEATTQDLRESSALRERLREEPTFYGGFDYSSPDALLDRYERAFRAYRDAQAADWKSRLSASIVQDTQSSQDPSRGADRPRSEIVLQVRREEYQALEAVVQFWRSVAIYEETKRTYSNARLPLIAGAIAAFLGLIGFAYAANPPKHESSCYRYGCSRRADPCAAHRGPRGPRGATGPPGPRGPEGARGPRGYSAITGS